MRRDVRYGPGAIDSVPQVVAQAGARRVLLVCGARSFAASGAERVLPHLERVADVRRWSDFAPNPDIRDLVRGLSVAEEFAPDLVLGVGGGTAMDMAKLICAFPGVTDEPKLAEAIRRGDAVTTRLPRLVLAPTTSGSGSECTHFAVVYIGEEKFSVAGPALRPDVAILDPALTLSGSRYQRATSGIDAVAQAIESLWAVGATDESRRWARHALGLLLPAIETYVDEPDDERAARAMAIGSHLAGRAIDISKTTAAHALSYGITKRFGLSHGHAVALTLGAFIEVNGTASAADLRPGVSEARHRAGMEMVMGALGATGPAAARERFESLCQRIGLDLHLPETARPREQVAVELAQTVNVERLSNNPVIVSSDDLVAVTLATTRRDRSQDG